MRRLDTDTGPFDLFTPPVHADDPPASHATAASMVEEAAAQRHLVMAYLHRRRERGATANECDVAMEWVHTRAGRSLSLLHKRFGAIARLKETRRTETGRPAHVYVLPEYINGRETR